MAFQHEWLEPAALVAVWTRLWERYKVPGQQGFMESLQIEHRPFWAYNWSFGALLSAAGKFSLLPDAKALIGRFEEDLWAATHVYQTNSGLQDSVPRFSPQFPGGVYFDDNAWVGLAAVDLSRGLGTDRWMALAQSLYAGIRAKGWDPNSGAVFWRDNPKATVNVCSTGPTLLLGLEVQAPSETTLPGELTAMQEWLWAMRNSRGLFHDHQDLRTGLVDPHIYTYNAGTPLEVYVRLAEWAPPADVWRSRAQSILDALPQFLSAGHYPCTPWFNVVLLRALARAMRRFDVSPLIAPFAREMDRAWQNFTDSGECLTLPCSSEQHHSLLRDRAAAAETLALLHRIYSAA